MRSYDHSRLTRPLLDRAHRLADSVAKKSPMKRSFRPNDVSQQLSGKLPKRPIPATNNQIHEFLI
ncbi:unnamed protein product [Dibothriocephalus latus]|uniref:Uncharacterized protein n=1 Tax=Dibothriocephalus latus TaxID=60516 RepID=A0A3P6QBE3_DIBLA|nr:unnamed protein product [Dibothriocephalus latus]